MNPQDIFNLVRQWNQEGKFWEKVRLHPFGVTVHTYLETGGYKHIIGNNLAGIKCTKGWLTKSISISNGRCVNAETKEYLNGDARIVDGAFRAYDSIDHFFLDYSRLIFLYYPVTRRNWDCVWGYFAGLHGKWATDPEYFYKLVDVAFFLSPKLIKRYVQKFIEELKVAISRDVLSLEFQKYIENRLP